MMTATARRGVSPHDATDALRKMADETQDENASANGTKPKAAPKGEQPPKQQQQQQQQQQSESDDGDDGDDDDDEDKAAAHDKEGKDGANAADKSDEKSSKKSRRELPPHTVAILKGWMLSPEHVKHPYPTDEDKQMLLKKTGINMKQLTNWFTNARKRIWKPMMRREHSRQLQSAMEYEKARARDVYPGGPGPMAAYHDGTYPPRAPIRHSFDAGSLGAPPRDAMAAYHRAYDAPPPHAYPAPPPHAYPPRVMRSVSESATGHDMDDYIDAMRIRKRVHEMAPEGGDADGVAHVDKRMRRGTLLSPRCLQILHEWVAAHAHMEYPLPADSDKLQLSRDTGLDVQQIELWFKTNVGRYGTLLQAQPPTAPPPVPSNMPHGHPAYRSIPSRDNPMYPPPPAYGERRSIPSQGNPMFPPRPAARSSIPGAGNPQFPPPPAVRRDSSDGYRTGVASAAYTSGGGYPPPPPTHPGYEGGDPSRPMRTLSINSAQYAQSSGQAPLAPPMPTPVGAPGSSGLPSLTGRALPSGTRGGPPMGQARDSRSHTLDMGQFADARRRKMNFQDILASTSAPPMPTHSAPGAQRPPLGGSGAAYDSSRPPNAENVYPSEVAAPYAQKMYEQQQRAGAAAAGAHPGASVGEPQAPGRI